MRTLILIAVSSAVLASCTLGKEQDPKEVVIPPQAKIQSGSVYPSMPLEEYQKLQSNQ